MEAAAEARESSRCPPLEALLALPTLTADGRCKHMLAVWADRLEVMRVSIHGDRLGVHLVGAALDVSDGGGEGGEAVVALLCSRETPLVLFTSSATQVRYPSPPTPLCRSHATHKVGVSNHPDVIRFSLGT